MDFLQDAAGKYLKQQFGGNGGSSEGGMDWSNLANLASKFTDADKKTQGELDPDTFKQHLFGGQGQQGGYGRYLPPQPGGESGYGRPQGGDDYERPHGGSGCGQPPPGYPTGDGASSPSGGHGPPPDANPDIIHQLLGAFSSQTGGEKFEGSSGQYQILAQLAKKLTGQDIPVPILEKLIKWKLGGLM